MNYICSKTIKKVILALAISTLIFTCSVNCFSNVIISSYGKKPTDDRDFTNGFTTFALTGDSYAGFLKDYEDDRKYKFDEYTIPAKPIEEIDEKIKEALNTIYPIVVFSIGVNDCLANTDPTDFAKRINGYMFDARFNGKIIICHTYMDFVTSKLTKHDYEPSTYDDIIKNLANEYPNVFYIDMHDYCKAKYQNKDNLHYGKEFYDALYLRIEELIDKLKNVTAEEYLAESESAKSND